MVAWALSSWFGVGVDCTDVIDVHGMGVEMAGGWGSGWDLATGEWSTVLV